MKIRVDFSRRPTYTRPEQYTARRQARRSRLDDYYSDNPVGLEEPWDFWDEVFSESDFWAD